MPADITIAMCTSGRELAEPRLSPDGSLVALSVRAGGDATIVVVPVAGGPERVVSIGPPPAVARGMGGGCFDWMPDGRALVYVGTDGELWLQPLDGRPRRITAHAPEAAARAPSVAPDGSVVAYAVEHVADGASVWLAVLDGVTPWRRIDDGAADFCADPVVDPARSRVVWQAWDVPDMPWDGARLEWAALDGGARGRIEGAGAIQQPRPAPDGSFLSARDDTGWLNVWRDETPLVDEAVEHAGPSWGMGQRSFAPSPDGRRVAFTRNEEGFGRLCVVDVDTGSVDIVGRGVHGQLGWVGDVLVALRSGARTPTQVVAYDTTTWERRTLAVGPVLAWDAQDLPEPEAVTVERDGVVLHARWYRAGADRTLCWVHGGPTDQWQVEFMPRVAYWWAQGYDVLVPDPRGTTGHGRAYQQALHGGWGEVDVDDTAAILRDAYERGDASPSSTVLVGGSSGGLTVLGVLGRHDGLAAGGVVSYPVTDLADLAERSHRFEAHYPLTLVGPRSDASRYAERSPLSYADRIAAPLLVLHGDADPVVPVDQSVRLASRVRDAGGDVELHLLPGEGHGFRRPEHRVAEYELMATFLDRVLGRRPDPYAAAMPFVSRSGEDDEQSSTTAAGAPPALEWDPDDPDTVNVHYDVSAWGLDERTELIGELAEQGVPHRWDGDELVVPEAVEPDVDALFERLESELGPFAVPLAADAPSTEFGLDEWPAADREVLEAALVEAEIPHRWVGATVVVAQDAEDAVDDLLDAIERGDLAPAGGSGGPPEGTLTTLFSVADRLARDPTDTPSRDDLLALAPQLDPRQPPFGIATRVWSRVVDATNALHEDFAGGAFESSDVIGHAQDLRTLVRPFV